MGYSQENGKSEMRMKLNYTNILNSGTGEQTDFSSQFFLILINITAKTFLNDKILLMRRVRESFYL